MLLQWMATGRLSNHSILRFWGRRRHLLLHVPALGAYKGSHVGVRLARWAGKQSWMVALTLIWWTTSGGTWWHFNYMGPCSHCEMFSSINWEKFGQQHKQCSGYCFALWKMGTKCPRIIVWFSGEGSINWSYSVSFQSSLPLTLLGWWWVGWNTSLTRHLFLQRCYAYWIVLQRMSFFGSADSSMRPADRMSPLT